MIPACITYYIYISDMSQELPVHVPTGTLIYFQPFRGCVDTRTNALQPHDNVVQRLTDFYSPVRSCRL